MSGAYKGICLALVCACVLCLSACGQQDGTGQQTDPASESVHGAAGEEPAWAAGFAAPDRPGEEQTLWAVQFQPWEHKSSTDPDGEKELVSLDSGVCGELFWYLGAEPYMDSRLKTAYVLDIHDTTGGENTVKRFTLPDLGLDSPMGVLDSMDMLDREHYVLRFADYEQDEEGMYRQTADRMLYTDLTGISRTVDLWEFYLEKGIIREEAADMPALRAVNWHCDGKGNIYVVDEKEDGSGGLYLFDSSGNLLLEYEEWQEQQIGEPMRTPEGELVFPVYDDAENSYAFLWADREAGELRSLGRMEARSPFIVQMYGMQGEDIYYRRSEAAQESIVRWNSRSGSQEQIFDFRAAGMDVGYRTMLALREGQLPVLRLTRYRDGKPREWFAALTEEKAAGDGVVRVADLTAGGESKARVAACAALATMETPGIVYEYEDVSSPEARDRIMAELTQGKGPDLLFVSTEDMRMLEEKGLLLDMGELIPRKLRDEILPGALEIGTVHGKLLGIPAGVQAETLVVAGDVWTGDNWRLEDVIALMEAGKLSGAIRNLPDYMMGKYTPPSLTMLELTKNSLADSFLIDWDNRKCHFDDQRFVSLLECAGTDQSGALVNREAWLNGGRDVLLGHFTNISDFLDFFVHLETEGGRIVGYPTEGSGGSYLTAEGGVLVVNANIGRQEEAACFLEILLGEELQAKQYSMCLSVRRLCPNDYIVEEESGRLVYMGGYAPREMPVFGEGDTSLHRAGAFLESCGAAPPNYSQINRIIAEELAAMCAGNQTAEAAAGVINSRVQIYLDENS